MKRLIFNKPINAVTEEEAEAKANSISDRCEIWDEDSGCWVI
jgi:hypothetical protein